MPVVYEVENGKVSHKGVDPKLCAVDGPHDVSKCGFMIFLESGKK